MDQPAALRPLVEAEDDIRRLDHYDSTRELAVAITAVAHALERSLRFRLRSDPAAPEAHRINALSAEHVPLEEVVRSLRTRSLISIEAAGTLHEAMAAARRARAGDVSAADADRVRAAVERLREELVAPEAVETTGDQRGEEEAQGNASRLTAAADARWMRWLAAAFAAAILLAAAWVAVRGGDDAYEDAMAAFRAGRQDSAAAGFERVLEDRPRDVTVMLYLARSYRRLERPEEAAELLRRAVQIDAEDAGVRRELGHLFMDLVRPASAVAQYERAVEYEPDNPLNWAALIRALRTLEDPRAEQLLRDAPPEVQAALRGA